MNTFGVILKPVIFYIFIIEHLALLEGGMTINVGEVRSHRSDGSLLFH